jgi:hypothetical protein
MQNTYTNPYRRKTLCMQRESSVFDIIDNE